MVNEPALVTGATGGLGRILVAALRAGGRPVIATGRNHDIGAEIAKTGARFLASDLARDDLGPLVGQVETIFHLAALSSPWGPESAFVAANVTATHRLLAAAQSAGCRRFIFTSTPSIYTRAKHQIGLTEETPLPERLVNAYARTKFAAELAVRGAASTGLHTVALRPRAIIGPFDTVLLPRLLKAADRGAIPLPGGGKALIETTDARDVVQALFAAEARAESLAGRVFNISGGCPLPFANLADLVFERLGRQVRKTALPARLVLALAGALEQIARLRPGTPEPALTRYGAMVLGWSQTFDLTAARDALGWTPIHHPKASIDWALERLVHA